MNFLKFITAMLMYWWWMRGPFSLRKNRWMFSHRLAFHKALNPYFGDGSNDRIAWPDGFLYLTPKDVVRAARAGKQGMRASTNEKPKA